MRGNCQNRGTRSLSRQSCRACHHLQYHGTMVLNHGVAAFDVSHCMPRVAKTTSLAQRTFATSRDCSCCSRSLMAAPSLLRPPSPPSPNTDNRSCSHAFADAAAFCRSRFATTSSGRRLLMKVACVLAESRLGPASVAACSGKPALRARSEAGVFFVRRSRSICWDRSQLLNRCLCAQPFRAPDAVTLCRTC